MEGVDVLISISSRTFIVYKIVYVSWDRLNIKTNGKLWK